MDWPKNFPKQYSQAEKRYKVKFGEIMTMNPITSAVPFPRVTRVDFLLKEEKVGQL